MSWILLFGVTLALGLALAAAFARRLELARMRRSLKERDEAVRQGKDKAKLQHPVIDLSRCLGCGTCVAVCPEDGVLELVHGQALVVRGARCQGISACERECPVGAITVALDNLEHRDDVPVLDENLEATGSPGLFLAGEVTAHALIKTAVEHGAAVASEVAARTRRAPPAPDDTLDLCIVGAGPAGLSCSLEAKRHGLRFVTLDQEGGPGGTVAKYPRRKLVLTQPVDLPLYGRLGRTTYTKEELVDLWHEIASEHRLPIRTGEVFAALERDAEGNYVVRTHTGAFRARHVCLALGRRGSPRKLGVPGEELPKVAYSLLDAQSYAGRRILVVGGGDSAVEAAVGLAEQPGNEVTLSYRQDSFFRVRARNEDRLRQSLGEDRLRVLYNSEVLSIDPQSVELSVQNGNGAQRISLLNDEVFVMAGGIPPLELLQRSGVSFDPALREAPTPLEEQGTGLVRALGAGFALALVAIAWTLWHSDYYLMSQAERAASPKHDLLRPGLGIGLGLGIASVALIGLNLAYLLRRASRLGVTLGSLRLWMTGHVATGILAFLCAALHSAMAPRNTVGGNAFWALGVLLLTGAIGRYFYAFVPRAANGRELELEEAKARLGRMSDEWDQGQRRFRERVREEIEALIEAQRWKSSFLGRVAGLALGQRDLRRVLTRLEAEGRSEGLARTQVLETLRLARKAHRTASMVAHYEDLRAILNSWRWIHKWAAALLVLLVVLHIVYALSYGAHFFDRGAG